MKRAAILPILFALLAGLLLAAGATNASRNQVQGVPWDAVDWESLCKSIEPLEYTSSTGQVCPRVHPTDPVWRQWHDPTGRGKPEPQWNCAAKARLHEGRVNTAGKCKKGFGFALKERARYPEDFDEPLEIWRARYFGPWIQGD